MRGIQLPPFVKSFEEASRVIGMLQDYLNTGVDKVAERGLKDHAILWLPQLFHGGPVVVSAGTAEWKQDGASPTCTVEVYYDGRGTVVANAKELTVSSVLGDPRFSGEPMVFVMQFRHGVIPATDQNVHLTNLLYDLTSYTPAEIEIRKKMLFAIKATTTDSSVDFVDDRWLRYYWLAIGPRRGDV
jgi:hypothetical protein